MMESIFSVLVAGSTERTLLCAKALAGDPRFAIAGVLTPSPRLIGRKQILTKNPLHQWAQANNLPVVLVEKKLDTEIQKAITNQLSTINFLLVVDFGYIVPKWLLDLPSIAPINIHPSELPNYRGSSPAQFALAFGETQSAVSVIVMDEKLDHGPIISKFPFDIDPTWTAAHYYVYAFNLIAHHLGDLLAGFADKHHAIPQPDISTTSTARMLKRDDGFVPYETLLKLISNLPAGRHGSKLEIGDSSSDLDIPFLSFYKLPATNYQLYCMWRGLHPWPGLWTLIDDNGTQKRMKLLSFHMDAQKLFLDEVQIEGENPKKFR